MKAGHVGRMCRQAFNQLIAEVEAGKSETLLAYLKAMALFHNYSLTNTTLIHHQKPDATHVAGYRTWQRQGRQVKKGSRGLVILPPIVRRVEGAEETEDMDDLEEPDVVGFKTAYLFDIRQTEGKPLPDLAKVKGDPGVYLDRLKRFIAGCGIRLQRSDRLGLTEGVSSGGVITANKNLSAAETFSVMVHELAHELLHQHEDQRQSHTLREAQAEAIAYVVAQAVGLECSTSCSDYLQLHGADQDTLTDLLERVQETAVMIISAIKDPENHQDVASCQVARMAAAQKKKTPAGNRRACDKSL